MRTPQVRGWGPYVGASVRPCLSGSMGKYGLRPRTPKGIILGRMTTKSVHQEGAP